MALSREAVTAVKQNADIVQIIGEKVALAASGANFKGLCPFHSEKTPSFTVNPQRGFYHCFGCGAGGSVIDFVMAMESLSFPEALGSLGARLNIQIGSAPAVDPNGRVRKALECAREFYHAGLISRPEGEAARMYLRDRGFEEDAWEAFGVGFAPEGWQGLTQFLTSREFTLEEQIAAGLVKRSNSGRPYDLLRNRVVFPIRETRTGCIAFGGRVISPLDQPKYLNTPETVLYRKSKVLFGLAESQDALRKQRRALLVEGYLDVIRLHSAGFNGAVATCGTALTPEHLSLLERHADSVVLIFDGDEAGMKAALRSAPLFFNKGLEARVMSLPDGLDPDDFLRQKGPEAFGEALERAVPLLEYLVVNTLQQHGRSPAGKEKALQQLAPLLAEVRQPAARDIAVGYLADLIQVRAEHIVGMLARKPGGTREGPSGEAPQAGAIFDLTARETRHQRMFLHILLRERSLLAPAREMLQPEELSDPNCRKLYETILALTDEEFAGMEPSQMAELYPQVAPLLRALLIENPIALQAVEGIESDLRYEITMIKEARKNELLQEFKQATGTCEEEPTLLRYIKVRDDLRAMKSVPGGRALVYDFQTAEVRLRRIEPNKDPDTSKLKNLARAAR